MKAGQATFENLAVGAPHRNTTLQAGITWSYAVTRSGFYMVSAYLRKVTASVSATGLNLTPKIAWTDNRGTISLSYLNDTNSASTAVMDSSDATDQPEAHATTVIWVAAGQNIVFDVTATNAENDVSSYGTIDVRYNVQLIDPF